MNRSRAYATLLILSFLFALLTGALSLYMVTSLGVTFPATLVFAYLAILAVLVVMTAIHLFRPRQASA